MESDARRLDDGKPFEADVCVVGAGPTGLALARACDAAGLTAVVLESGGRRFDRWTQQLNDGAVIGDAYAGLGVTRHRQVGGSAAIWNTPVGRSIGAKYVPLDPEDLTPREDPPRIGWPIAFGELEPCFRRAQAVCGLGPFSYDAAAWADPSRPPLSLPGGLWTSAVYQLGPGRLFTRDYPAELARSRRVRLVEYATVCELLAGPGGGRIVGARFRNPSGAGGVVRAGAVVLAAGAVESTRLLLLSGLSRGVAWGNEGGWLGRGFMEHPRDDGVTLLADQPDLFRRLGFYRAHRGHDGTLIAGRLSLSAETRAAGQFPNASVSILPVEPEQPGGIRGWFRRHQASPSVFRLRANFEQRADPDNCIRLGPDLDPLGTPRVELHWRWRPEEQAGLERLRISLREAFESARLGRVSIEAGRPPDPNARHHAGTTRLSESPRDGVVDTDLRVHGTENLYVAAASVFPSAGYANPTLTCVALALRLADHLAGSGSGPRGRSGGSSANS